MANPSQLFPAGAYPVRSDTTRIDPRGEHAPEQAPAETPGKAHAADADSGIIGPRKLIRPTLPARALKDRSFSRRNDPVLAHHAAMANTHATPESSHAEAFYFQKQAQAQTLMVFVLEDGETIEGYIEWYDRNAIKIRNGKRTLIYKSSIKYLYKAGENRPQL